MLILRSSFVKCLLFFGLPSSTIMATSDRNYRFLEKVPGYGRRRNDVLVFPQSSQSSVVYYFGGDIQVRIED